MMKLSAQFAIRYIVMAEGNQLVEVKRIITSFPHSFSYLELFHSYPFAFQICLEEITCKHVDNVFLTLNNRMYLVIILMILSVCNSA